MSKPLTYKQIFPTRFLTKILQHIIVTHFTPSSSPSLSVPVAPAKGGREECDGEEEEVEGEEGEQTLVVLAHHVARAARAVVEEGLWKFVFSVPLPKLNV